VDGVGVVHAAAAAPEPYLSIPRARAGEEEREPNRTDRRWMDNSGQ
jgi:hypothetical protein